MKYTHTVFKYMKILMSLRVIASFLISRFERLLVENQKQRQKSREEFVGNN